MTNDEDSDGDGGGEKCDMAGLLEGKSFGTNPTRYGPGWGRLGLTAAERRAREEVRDRWKAVDGIDSVQHAHVQPPPLRARVEATIAGCEDCVVSACRRFVRLRSGFVRPLFVVSPCGRRRVLWPLPWLYQCLKLH